PKPLEPKVLPINLTEAQKDLVLRPLITDIGVIAWKPEAGRTADQVRESAGYAAFLNGNDIRPEQQPLLNDIGNLTLTFPHADSDDPAVFTADPLTELDLQQAADLLSQVPGVDEARVVKLRGMWFRAQVSTEGPPGREADGMGPVISQPGIQGGAVLTEPGSAGKTRYTPYVVYVGGGVDRNALDRIKTSLAEHWGAAAGDVVLTPQKIDPE
ncbi:hypothetical protein AB0M20_37965, partial [Actinoplanes sp. NPDC051633]|uniref:hypothetical protein n=1 Tax=Actinoplanes sp. NPDC051633 TaxID=3155670 RepID=UPI00341DDB81